MRVCFISHSSRIGGAERILLETIEILRSEGIECRVVLPDHGELCTELQRIDVQFSIIAFPLWVKRGEARIFDRLKTALNITIKTPVIVWKIFRWKSDLVHTNTVTVCIGAIAARLLGRPHIWHLQEFGFEDQGLSFLFGQRLSLGLINLFSSRCICLSTALSKKYEQFIEPTKIAVIYPSMHRAFKQAEDTSYDDCSFIPPNKRFRCVIVGTLIEGKGQEDAVLAVAVLEKIGIDVELIIVGDGEAAYRSRLEGVIRSHCLDSRVVFIRQVKNSIKVMRSANVVLVCSRSEAFGRVTIEAMLSGRPVIGARSAATSELIQEGVNGLLYNPADPKDLADKIQYLCENSDAGDRLVKNARAWVEKSFTIDRYREELLEVLISISGCDGASAGRRRTG